MILHLRVPAKGVIMPQKMLFLIFHTLICGVVMTMPFSAVAEVFLCEDEAGLISLSNMDEKKKCKKMKLQPKPKQPPNYVQDKNNNQQNQSANQDSKKEVAAVTPSSAEAAAERKRIVMEELGLEKRRLESVLSQVATVSLRTDSDAERQKFLASVKKKESLHRSNIELLEKEFSRLD